MFLALCGSLVFAISVLANPTTSSSAGCPVPTLELADHAVISALHDSDLHRHTLPGHIRPSFGNPCSTSLEMNLPRPSLSPPQKRQSEDERCGVQFGKCAQGQCCSAAGFCGNGKEYCEAPDCQLDYGPACDGLQTPIGASTIGIKRPLVGNVPYGGNGIFSCTVPNTFALTFDDGPWKYTDELLDLLEIYNAKATFFMTGNNNGKGKISNTSLPWPTILKRMDADGHQIASHTWSHQDLSRISPARRAEQIIRNEMAFRNVLGKFPTYMRPPYSSCTVASGCEADMRKFGYHIVYFDLDTADYLNDAPNLIQNSKNRFLTALDKGESNYLAIEHDIHQQTVQNLTEYMLQSLGEEGYSAVTVGACLGDPKANWYRSVAVKSQGPRLRDEVAQPELYTRDAPNSTLPLPTPGGLSPSPSADCIAPMDCFRSHRGGCMDCRAADL